MIDAIANWLPNLFLVFEDLLTVLIINIYVNIEIWKIDNYSKQI